MAEWYVKEKGKTVGPITNAQLAERVRSGAVTPETPVSKGNSRWVRAGAVDGLFKEEGPSFHYVCPYCGHAVNPPPTRCDGCNRSLSSAFEKKTLSSAPGSAGNQKRGLFGWMRKR